MERNRTPDWLLERLVAGDLPDSEAAEIQRRVAAEPDGPQRLAAIRASNEAILAAHPAPRLAAAIRHRAEGQAPKKRRFSPFALTLAAPAVAIFLVVFLQDTTPDVPGEQLPPEVIRLKGDGPKLLVHRQRAGEPERVAEGSEARARDLLQLSYQAGGAAYGVVVSVDGNGNVTRHLPANGTTAAALDPDGAVALPASYELDDAPAFERFFLVSAAAPFSVEQVVDAAAWLAKSAAPESGELPLPPSLRQTSFLVKKVP